MNQNIDRYLAVVSRARKLFSRNGLLVLSVGGVPSIYNRVEKAAWRKYIDTTSSKSGTEHH